MQFIGQVALSDEFGFTTPARMAYLFMTGDDEDFVDGTYEPDGGENAVILQPGATTLPTKAVTNGPSLYRMIQQPGNDRLQAEPCEFSVEIVEAEDVEFVSEDDRWRMSEEEAASVTGKLDENKVGGTPCSCRKMNFRSIKAGNCCSSLTRVDCRLRSMSVTLVWAALS